MTNEQIKVLIGDDTTEYGIKIASRLMEFGMYAFTRRKDGNVILDSIQKDMPDVVIADLSMPNFDAIALMREVGKMSNVSTVFIITAPIKNNFIERQVIENGASYFLVRPFEAETLCSLIKSVVHKCISSECNDLEIIVTDLIHRLGVPAHINGYHYLRTAILESLQNHALLDCVTKRLYPVVAAQFDTTPTRVERAIRHAIEVSWTRGNSEVLNSFFGYTIDTYRGKPTNSEFIALIADRLDIHCKSAISK